MGSRRAPRSSRRASSRVSSSVSSRPSGSRTRCWPPPCSGCCSTTETHGSMTCSSLVCIVYGGAPMTPQLLREVLDFFPCGLMQGYGGSEAGQVLYLSPDDHRASRVDSNGHPVPGVQVEVRDQSGDPVRPGAAGELYARSEMLMAGYWRDPVNTRKVLPDGWYATGDLAQQEPDGYAWPGMVRLLLRGRRDSRRRPRQCPAVAGGRLAAVHLVREPLRAVPGRGQYRTAAGGFRW